MNNLFLVIGDNRSIQTTSDSGCFADTSEFAVAGFLFQLSLNKGNNLAKLSLKKGKLVYFYIINDKLPSCICKNEQSLWFSLDCLFEGPFPERSDFNAAMFVKKWCRYGFGKVIWNKRSNNDTTTENKNQRLDVPIKRSGLSGYQWVEREAECVSSPHSARITRMLVRIMAHRTRRTHRKERCQNRYVCAFRDFSVRLKMVKASVVSAPVVGEAMTTGLLWTSRKSVRFVKSVIF